MDINIFQSSNIKRNNCTEICLKLYTRQAQWESLSLRVDSPEWFYAADILYVTCSCTWLVCSSCVMLVCSLCTVISCCLFSAHLTKQCVHTIRVYSSHPCTHDFTGRFNKYLSNWAICSPNHPENEFFFISAMFWPVCTGRFWFLE